MRIADLARLSGMSPSAFHRHFRTITAMSPLQFQKRIRPQEARTLLAAHPGDVAGVGHLVGYDSPPQFSREYHRLFGAPPGQDAARLRTAPPARIRLIRLSYAGRSPARVSMTRRRTAASAGRLPASAWRLPAAARAWRQ
jgi:AraC-like DNA-binding protein